MIEYGCGCTSKGLLILDGTPTMFSAYQRWSMTVGIYGDKSLCFKCWYAQEDKEFIPKPTAGNPIVFRYPKGTRRRNY